MNRSIYGRESLCQWIKCKLYRLSSIRWGEVVGMSWLQCLLSGGRFDLFGIIVLSFLWYFSLETNQYQTIWYLGKWSFCTFVSYTFKWSEMHIITLGCQRCWKIDRQNSCTSLSINYLESQYLFINLRILFDNWMYIWQAFQNLSNQFDLNCFSSPK